MEDSEKRGLGVFARRQQQQQRSMTPPRVIVSRRQQHQRSTIPPRIKVEPPPSPQRKTRRKVSDFMMGVAAALSARKSNDMAQTPIPRHIDISYRDKTDVSAKRRFQVKVPFRLMTILGLVFLILPFLVFLHKELHMHEDQYISHYKSENYAHVNTKDVWDNFKQATTTDDAVQEEVKVNATISKQQIQLEEENPDGFASGVQQEQNRTGTRSDAQENETTKGETQVQEHDLGDSPNADESPQEAGSIALDQGDHNDLSSDKAVVPNLLIEEESVEGSNNDKDEINVDNVETTGIEVDSDASKDISNR